MDDRPGLLVGRLVVAGPHCTVLLCAEERRAREDEWTVLASIPPDQRIISRLGHHRSICIVNIHVLHFVPIGEDMPCSRWKSHLLPVEDRRFIHVNPDAIKGTCLIESLWLELLRPEITSWFVKEVNPHGQPRPALALEEIAILALDEDIRNGRLIEGFDVMETQTFVVDIVILLFLFCLLAFVLLFLLRRLIADSLVVLSYRILIDDFDVRVYNHHETATALLDDRVELLVVKFREHQWVESEILSFVSMRDVHPEHVEGNARYLKVYVAIH